MSYYRADSRLSPSQWETSLQSNAISHWLGAILESALYYPTPEVNGTECKLAHPLPPTTNPASIIIIPPPPTPPPTHPIHLTCCWSSWQPRSWWSWQLCWAHLQSDQAVSAVNKQHNKGPLAQTSIHTIPPEKGPSSGARADLRDGDKTVPHAQVNSGQITGCRIATRCRGRMGDQGTDVTM